MQNLASSNSLLYIQAAFEQQLVTTIAAINFPFSTVENVQFCQTLPMLRPDVQIPGRKRVKAFLEEHYSQIAVKSFQDLGANIKVFFALDCWTSTNHVSFMAITVYYISENWHFYKALIAFEHVLESHTGHNIAILVDCAFQQYRLSEKLYAITTDNASNNDTLRSQLAKILASQSVD